MNKRLFKLAPSILSADFARLGEQVAEAEKHGMDYVHIDVMDGHFVPNITVGPLIVKALRPHTIKTLDTHLMISQPDQYIEDFVEAGSDIITVHVEACPHLYRTVTKIQSYGVKAGVSLNPATPLGALEEVLPLVDLVLIMSVNPGFGGQKYIPSCTDKIRRLRSLLEQHNPTAELEVDGGVNAENIQEVVGAGANVIVAGSAIFNDHQSVAKNIQRLRQRAEA